MPKPRGRTDFSDVETHCIVCTTLVPPDRRKYKAITCSDECAIKRKNSIRARQDLRECRYCRKPSTPEDRAAFSRFRKLEDKRPDLLYPQAFEAWLRGHEEFHGVDAAKVAAAFAKFFWSVPELAAEEVRIDNHPL